MVSSSKKTCGTDGTDESGVTEKSGKRGIVNMLKVKKARSKGLVRTVEWNDRGQPIGEESSKLAFFIGNYARWNIPITCDDWRKKEWLPIKQALCDEIKETFHGIGDEHLKNIKKRAGELHRQFRGRLRSLAVDDNGNFSTEPPAEYASFSSVTPYWKEFVEQARKEEFKEKSKRNKEQAQKMEARYRKACLGYARIREIIMQEKVKQGVKDYVVSRLDVWEYGRRNKNGVVDDPATLKLLEEVGKNPCLLYLDPGRRHVGQGILHNDLNDRIIHGVPLEEGYVRVQFEVAVKSEFNSKLPVPCDEANLIGEAPGYFLAWPRKLVSLNLETPARTVNKEKERTINNEKVNNGVRKHGMNHKKKPDDIQKEKTVESNIVVSSKPLGYPLKDDVCHHDGVMEIVRVAIVLEQVTDVEVHMDYVYWNANPWIEHINKENVLEVLDAQWLSSSSLCFYIRYLYEVYLSKNLELASKFSFVSPHMVSPLVENSDTTLAKCLLGHINKDHLLLLPYNVSKHWVLVAINTKTEVIYFMDPARMTNNTYYKDVKTLVETALRTFRTHNKKSYTWTAFNSFTWMNVQCPKQALDDGIYCAYYVGCFIEDIICRNETTIDVNFTHSPKLKTYPPDKMISFQKNWAGYFYNRFLKNKLLIK